MKRRLNTTALLAGACALLLPRLALAQAAEAPAEAPKEAEQAAEQPAEAPPPEAPKAEEAPPPAPDVPPAATAEPKAEARATIAAPATPAAGGDRLAAPGYIPGYRTYVGVGIAPYNPRVGSLPGGMTPSFGAPSPSDDWSFNFTGFMSASVRASINERKNPAPGQSSTVLHAAPTTIDSYGSFNDTGATPGNWVGMIFSYGNRYVTGYVSFDTYNPTRGTNYRAIGSQYFINDTFVAIRVPPLDKLRLFWNVGSFTQPYGRLGRYGGGLYNPPMIGSVSGVGEIVTAEYDLNDTLTLVLDDGFGGGTKTGKTPIGTLNSAQSNFQDSNAPASWNHHVHLGLRRKGDTTVQLTGHFMSNWSQDDAVPARLTDNPDTRQWDESKPRDGHIHVVGADLKLISQTYGYLAFGGMYLDAKNSYRLRGLSTYAQDGVRVSDDWLGATTGGTGSIWAAAFNYEFSIGSILRAPTPFWGDGPDVHVETSFQVAGTNSEDKQFDGRIKQKFGADVLYTFIPWLGVGIRADRIAPNSKDPKETFYDLQARLQFRSTWQSHETVTLKYSKWFYGDHTHGDGWDARPREQLDDQMIGLGFGMWW
jgi:hypothetical protein